MGKGHQKGFTIVELLIVIVVIAILATISIVAYNGIQERAQSTAAIAQAKKVIEAIRLVAIDEGRYANSSCLVPADSVTDDTICPEARYWYSNVPRDGAFIAKLEERMGTKIKLTTYGASNPAGMMWFQGTYWAGNMSVFYYAVGPNSECGMPGVLSPTPGYDNMTLAGAAYTSRSGGATHCMIEVEKW